MSRRAAEPTIAETIAAISPPPELAEIEGRLSQLRERLGDLAADDQVAQRMWDGADLAKQRKSNGLRQRIAQRRREANDRIAAELRRRNELRAQHASQLVLKLTPRRRKAQRQIAVAYEQMCA